MYRKLVSIVPKHVFGPVPSRRLGLSLGINNIPYKICSYSCVYCQLGNTLVLSVERKPYSTPEVVVKELDDVLSRANPDYITFVPDGEPTLDSNLGLTAKLIKENFDVKLAILTNSSLLSREDVREDLMVFDLVSLKVDGVDEDVWRSVNRPHESLVLEKVLRGIELFADEYKGKIITETMLVSELNTDTRSLEHTARFLSRLKISKSYIAIPIRPPAESWVKPPSEEELLRAYNVFSRFLGSEHVELLNMPEPESFVVTSDAIKYMLDVIRVHPLRLEYAIKILSKDYEEPLKVLHDLEAKGAVRIIKYESIQYVVSALRK